MNHLETKHKPISWSKDYQGAPNGAREQNAGMCYTAHTQITGKTKPGTEERLKRVIYQPLPGERRHKG